MICWKCAGQQHEKCTAVLKGEKTHCDCQHRSGDYLVLRNGANEDAAEKKR